MTKKVFIVEDDEIYAEFLKKNLRTKYKIYSYGTAEDAIVAIKSIVPDVLIIDYKLPQKNGIELYEEVKEQIKYATKVIMMSGIDDGNLVLDFIKKGIRDYVIKDENVVKTLTDIIEDSGDIYHESGLGD